MKFRHILILKNDAVGDLVKSIKTINNLITDPDIKKITICLSELNKDFLFLFKSPKVQSITVKNNMTIKDKFKIFYFIILNKISDIFILTPKSFYFFLPTIFIRTRFYAICVNNIKNNKRPSEFLRRFLYKYKINDRSVIFKRESISELQEKLTKFNSKNETIKINIELGSNLQKYLPKNYIYFHLNKKRLAGLEWNFDKLKLFFDELLNYCEKLVITKDIGVDDNTKILRDNFSFFDLRTGDFIKKNEKIIFFDNVHGQDLYNIIRHSKKVVAFHGMMTNLASIEKKEVLDLFFCKINNWNDYRNYRNSFYEFKPKYDGYDFIIPSKNINKTIKKIKFSLIK